MKFTRKHPADVANVYIRNLLANISEALCEDREGGCFSDEDMERTKRYFKNVCPYSGLKLNAKNTHIDHIIPQNRESCGLNLYGNLVPCHKDHNWSKGNKHFEDYINSLDDNEEDKVRRIDAIKEFQKISGYEQKVSLVRDIKQLVQNEYERVHQEATESFLSRRSEILVSDFEDEKNEVEAELTRNAEIIKVQRKVPEWFLKPDQKNSSILLLFLNQGKEALSLQEFKECCNDIPNLDSSLSNMSSFNPKSDGMIFDIDKDNDSISLWPPVKDFIIAEYNNYKSKQT